jgi:ATP-dependent DNA helicase RecG
VTTAEAQEQIAALQRFNADRTHIEAKEAKTDLPQKIWQTVSAFSNTHDGGTIIFGVSEQEKFQIVGVRNAAKIQHDLGCLCSDGMKPAIRPAIELHSIKGKHIVTAAIPELTPQLKPCYFKEAGYTNGAYIRVADGDRKLTSYEVHMMLTSRMHRKTIRNLLRRQP